MNRRGRTVTCITATLAAVMLSFSVTAAKSASQFREYWSCVPYARAVSAIDLQGDAWRWWDAATGRYGKWSAPSPGAVLVFKRSKDLRRGHVAVVRSIVDSRTIVVDHANWGARGRKGIIDRDVPVIDVSAHNDWSAARVWYPPIDDFGSSTYATHGFIYPPGARPATPQLLQVSVTRSAAPTGGTGANLRPERKPRMVVMVLPLRKPLVD